jgi:pimeloyl-ACP methyl ester carboxylesterase
MNSNRPNLEGLFTRAEGDGPPVILLHGLGGSSDEWDQTCEALHRNGYRTYRVDLPGHGSSEKPSELKDYQGSRFVDWIDAWYRNLKLVEGAVLVAHSFGAYLALNLAANNPGRIRCMALISPFFYPGQLLPLMRLTAHRPKVASRILEATPRKAIETLIQFASSVNNSLPPAAVRQSAADLTRASPKILHVAPSIEDQRPRISGIDIPTLIVWGGRDLTLNPASFPEILIKFQDARGLIYERSGHTPHLSSADEFNENLIEFIAKGSFPSSDD